MFADPIVVTPPVLGATSLVRVGISPTEGSYRLVSGVDTYDLKFGHQFGPKRNRVVARFQRTSTVTTAFQPALNERAMTAAYLVVDSPLYGYTAAQVQDIANGLIALMTSANVLKLINGEV